MYRGYIIGGGIVAFFAVLFFVSPLLRDFFFAITRDTGNFAAQNAELAILFFIVLAALSALLSPFSSTPIVPVAVALWGIESTFALLLFGWLLGDALAYAIGRFGAHTFLKQFIREEKLNGYEQYVFKHITFISALLARLAFPAEIGYVFGLIRYKFGAYMLVTFIAEAVFAVPTVLAADALIALRPAAFAGWMLAFVAAIAFFYLLFRIVLKKRK